MMAQYNAWQNKQLLPIVNAMTADELTKERGAFFGSIQRTLSHLLWGDTLWIARFDGGEGVPTGNIQKHADLWPTNAEWAAQRVLCDARIIAWADGLNGTDLVGDFSWNYSDTGELASRPYALVVTHFFNHQTHHRGQVHAMLTAAGQQAPVSDLSYMPEDV